jgi:hypothetical protein
VNKARILIYLEPGTHADYEAALAKVKAFVPAFKVVVQNDSFTTYGNPLTNTFMVPIPSQTQA